MSVTPNAPRGAIRRTCGGTTRAPAGPWDAAFASAGGPRARPRRFPPGATACSSSGLERNVRGRRGNAARAAADPGRGRGHPGPVSGRAQRRPRRGGRQRRHPRSPHRRAPDAQGAARGSGARTGVQRRRTHACDDGRRRPGAGLGPALGRGARDPDRTHRRRQHPHGQRRRPHALHRRARRPDHRLGHRRGPPPRAPVPSGRSGRAAIRRRSRSVRPAGRLPPGSPTAACACTTPAPCAACATCRGSRTRPVAASSSAPTVDRSP